KQLAFDEAGTQVAFVSDREEHARPEPRNALYHASLPGGTPEVVVSPAALEADEIVSSNADVRLVKTGSAVVFGIAPAPLDSIPADSLADKAVFDLWHYKDARLQPEQIVRAGRDRNRSYTAVVQLRGRRLVRLATDSLPQVTVGDDGRS